MWWGARPAAQPRGVLCFFFSSNAEMHHQSITPAFWAIAMPPAVQLPRREVRRGTQKQCHQGHRCQRQLHALAVVDQACAAGLPDGARAVDENALP